MLSIQLLIPASIFCALLALLLGALCGSPLMGFITQLQGQKSGLKFYAKFALQISRLGLILAWIWLALVVLFLLFAKLNWPFGQILPKPLPLNFIYIQTGLLVLGIIFLSLFHLGLKKTKNSGVFNLFWAVLSFISFAGSAASSINLQMHFLIYGNLRPEALAWVDFLLYSGSGAYYFWIFWIHFILFSLAAAAITGLPYLIQRRNKDDFGRDYYLFALPLGAKWSLIFLLQLPLLVWIFYFFKTHLPLSGLDPAYLFCIGVCAALLFAASFLWILLIRAPNPLRYKGTVFSGFLSAWLGFSAFICSTLLLLASSRPELLSQVRSLIA